MRIIGGEWGGRPLFAPRSGARPTQDRVRQVLFDLLGGAAGEGPVLDLYAGTGALGLEALSRGAPRAVFVEASRPVRLVLERNVRTLEAGERARVLGLPVRRALGVLRAEGEAFRIVLADPPYDDGEAADLLDLLGAEDAPWVEPGGLLVLETRDRDPVGAGTPRLRRERSRAVGGTSLHFYRRQ